MPEAQILPGAAGPAGGPLRAVLDAILDGAPTPAAVARATGLPLGLVRLAVDRLVAAGTLAPADLTEDCGGGCGGCPLASAASGCLVRGRLLTPARAPDRRPPRRRPEAVDDARRARAAAD